MVKKKIKSMLNFVLEFMEYGVEIRLVFGMWGEGLDSWVCGLWIRLICFEWLLDEEGLRVYCLNDFMFGVVE